jgi:hypothetical protein
MTQEIFIEDESWGYFGKARWINGNMVHVDNTDGGKGGELFANSHVGKYSGWGCKRA